MYVLIELKIIHIILEKIFHKVIRKKIYIGDYKNKLIHFVCIKISHEFDT